MQNTSELVLCKCAESPRDVSTYLKSIMNSLDESESSLLLESLIYVGRCDLSGDDKTVDRYICLHELLKARYMLHRSESDFRASVAVLERTIEICDQASAVGMTGWMEFGSPSSLERLNLLPLEQLSRLASFYGQIGCWDKVAETTMSLLLRSERSLPLYHPRTVVALLDHTAALLRTKISRNVRQAGKFLDRSNERISLFLTEHIKRHRSQELNADAPRVDGASRSSMNWVRGFTAALKELGVRPFASILGTCDPSVLLYNSYLGDALSVLAKYGGQPPPIKLSFSESLWKLAAQFYRVALRGWLHIGGRRHANVPLTACGLARCLWEVNQRSECIDILSFAIGSSRGSVPLRSLESSELVSNRAGASSTEPPSDAELKCTLLISCQVNQLVSRMKLAYEESLAVCLWWMAAYFVEASANDRSRLRALSLLHAATEALQIGLKNQCAGSQKAREKCSKFVEVVEKEAKELFST